MGIKRTPQWTRWGGGGGRRNLGWGAQLPDLRRGHQSYGREAPAQQGFSWRWGPSHLVRHNHWLAFYGFFSEGHLVSDLHYSGWSQDWRVSEVPFRSIVGLYAGLLTLDCVVTLDCWGAMACCFPSVYLTKVEHSRILLLGEDVRCSSPALLIRGVPRLASAQSTAWSF